MIAICFLVCFIRNHTRAVLYVLTHARVPGELRVRCEACICGELRSDRPECGNSWYGPTQFHVHSRVDMHGVWHCWTQSDAGTTCLPVVSAPLLRQPPSRSSCSNVRAFWGGSSQKAGFHVEAEGLSYTCGVLLWTQNCILEVLYVRSSAALSLSYIVQYLIT